MNIFWIFPGNELFFALNIICVVCSFTRFLSFSSFDSPKSVFVWSLYPASWMTLTAFLLGLWIVDILCLCSHCPKPQHNKLNMEEILNSIEWQSDPEPVLLYLILQCFGTWLVWSCLMCDFQLIYSSIVTPRNDSISTPSN